MDDEPPDIRATSIRVILRRRPVPGPLRSVVRARSGVGTLLAILSGAATAAAFSLAFLSSRGGGERPPLRPSLPEPVPLASVAAAVPAKAALPSAAPGATSPAPPDAAPLVSPSPPKTTKADTPARAASRPALTLDLLPVLSREAAEMDYGPSTDSKPRRPGTQR